MSTLIGIKRKPVDLTDENIVLAIASPHFQSWFTTLDPRFGTESIDFQSVDLKYKDGKPLISRIKFVGNMVDEVGTHSSRSVFMRGGSVVILVVMECEGLEYTLLTVQPRFPTGIFAFPEIPAGTIEDDGNFVEEAIREIGEETPFVIKKEDLFDLTEFFYGDKFKGVFATPGGSDEYFRIFVFRTAVTRDYLESLQGKLTGLAVENERITLKVIRLSDLPLETPDAKSLSAFVLYERAKKAGVLLS